MKSIITIKDETLSGKINSEFTISTDQESMSIAEIIKERVYQEVQDYNEKMPEYFRGLVQPTNAEKVLNGYKLKQRRQIDPEKQTYLALGAFQKNSFFILVNDRQITDIDEKIHLRKDMKISFLKLTPLVGG